MKKQLKEELIRFKQILNYKLGGENLIKESVEDQVIGELIDEISAVTPISKSDHTFESATLLQAILVDAGYCVHSKVCNKLDGDFGDTTANSLKDFIDKTSLKNEDLEVLEDKMVEKVNEEGKTFINTKEKADERIKLRDRKFRKMGIHLEYLTPEMAKYFRKWYRHNKALEVTGEDVEEDIVNYIVKKEGGLTDTSTDRAKTKNLKESKNVFKNTKKIT